VAAVAMGWCAFGESAAESVGMATTWPPRTVIRKSSGLRTLESALYRSGLGPVAGVDEVGRGACAGPLVVAACVLGPGRMESLGALDDSKKLTEKAREQLYPLICRYALAYHVVFIPSVDVDRRGVHVANIEGMRRAVAGLSVRPGYVLSDGFRVPGLPVPSLPVIGGDAAAACIAAASVLAKVSRDRLMVAMDADHPGYGFAEHKGYSTLAHSAALTELGPCPQHRYSFINVRRVATGSGGRLRLVADFKPGPPGLHADNGWGKMEPGNEVRPEWAEPGELDRRGDDADRSRSAEEPGELDGEGRLSR
jgi:ribonuclease HII